MNEVTVILMPAVDKAFPNLSAMDKYGFVLSYALTKTNISSTPMPNNRNGNTFINGE